MTCDSCGADLRARDRYCGACGMPNTKGNLHPRFGPVAEEHPLYPEPREPTADEVLCLRCQRPTARTDTYCAWCGIEIEDAVLAHDRAAELASRRFKPAAFDPFRPLRAWAAVTRVLLWCVAVVSAAALVLLGARFATLEGASLGGQDPETVADWSDRAMWVLLGLGALTGVSTVVWTRRATRNLRPLEVSDARYPTWTGWACWFIPVANLVLPYLVVEDLWRCSSTTGPPITRARRRDHPPFALHLWWPALVLGGLLMGLGRLAMPGDPAADIDTWRIVLVLGGVGALLLTLGALSLPVVVDDVTTRQARRAELLEQPTTPQVPAEDDTPFEPVPLRQVEDGPTWGRY